MTVKLLTEHNLELLSFKGGCTSSSVSTLVKTPQCWKSHVTAHMYSRIVTQLIPFVDPALESLFLPALPFFTLGRGRTLSCDGSLGGWGCTIGISCCCSKMKKNAI